MKRFVQNLLTVTLVAAMPLSVMAEQMAAPTGTAVLTVTGNIDSTNADNALVLDRELLATLPVTTFETSTIWTDGVHSFTGVSLADLAAELGVEDGHFLATAINDYTVEIPVSDAVEGGPIIAYLMDGEEMSVRDKGPLWVIYPYDSNAAYRTEVVYSRSIWQLDRLDIVE
ncbi:molybdopterin-dependent oxidoreductase [Pseudooctadecabacter sp.]|uniref:molybdopterin-dependent oxidoreductase n=1 Tax=Pseudooctadecabacter sp. TaxID=1966338 RepID=UPI0035C7BB90